MFILTLIYLERERWGYFIEIFWLFKTWNKVDDIMELGEKRMSTNVGSNLKHRPVLSELSWTVI